MKQFIFFFSLFVGAYAYSCYGPQHVFLGLLDKQSSKKRTTSSSQQLIVDLGCKSLSNNTVDFSLAVVIGKGSRRSFSKGKMKGVFPGSSRSVQLQRRVSGALSSPQIKFGLGKINGQRQSLILDRYASGTRGSIAGVPVQCTLKQYSVK